MASVTQTTHVVANSSLTCSITLTATESSTNVSGNYSVINWSCKATYTGSLGFSGTSRPNAGGIYATVGNQVVINANCITLPSGASSGTVLYSGSGSVNVGHSDDGTGSCSVYLDVNAGVDQRNSTWYWADANPVSTSFTMSNIARASNPTVSPSPFNIGDTITIKTNRASNTFKHDCSMSFAYNSGGTITVSGASIVSDKSLTDSITFDTRTAKTSDGKSLYDTLITACGSSGTSTDVSVFLVTYDASGNTIGSKTVHLQANVDTKTVVPTVNKPAIVEATSGLATQFGAFIQNHSTLKFTCSASGTHGSTITGYTVSIDGKNYPAKDAVSTTDTITKSGDVAYTITATDSRGATATYSGTVPILEYKEPTGTITAKRSLKDGKPDDQNGTCANIAYSFTITALGDKNTHNVIIQYKKHDASTWTDLTTITNSYTANATYQDTAGIFTAEYSWDTRLVITDYFRTSDNPVTPSSGVTTTFTLLNFGAGGKSIGIGMQSSNDGSVEFKLPVKFLSSIYPGIVLTTPTDSGNGVMIPSGSDLNDVKFTDTTKVFWAGTYDAAKTFKNKPSNISAFYMYSLSPNGGSNSAISGIWQYRLQVIIDIDGRILWRKAWRGSDTTVNFTRWRNQYDLGDIYITTAEDDPSRLFGGTWQKVGTDKYLKGVSTKAGTEGGSSTSAMNIYTTASEARGYGLTQTAGFENRVLVTGDGFDGNVKSESPYYAVYIWRKIAQ